MMKNRIATLIPAALLALSLAACGQATTNTPAESPAAEATVIEEEAQQTPAAETTTEEAAPERILRRLSLRTAAPGFALSMRSDNQPRRRL